MVDETQRHTNAFFTPYKNLIDLDQIRNLNNLFLTLKLSTEFHVCQMAGRQDSCRYMKKSEISNDSLRKTKKVRANGVKIRVLRPQ